MLGGERVYIYLICMRVSLEGAAIHGGGSCQASLSYDNGGTFKVLKSWIGIYPLPPFLRELEIKTDCVDG